MYRPRRIPTDQRRGVILLVVITLLTLFAIVGLTFVLYAQGEATASRIFREAPIDPLTVEPVDIVFSWALGELIYDVSDDPKGVNSAIRGHGLARHIYGWNDGQPSGNTAPFNGTGALHTTNGDVLRPCMNPFGQDDYYLPNYTYFLADNFLRDPERLYPNYVGNQFWRLNPTSPRGPYTAGANAPYTYPDLNNMSLAAVRADGVVLAPSFHRAASSWALDPTNWRWFTDTAPAGDPLAGQTFPYLKYQVLRPRPADHLLAGETFQQVAPGQWQVMPSGRPYFGAPADAGGDVKNLVGAPGGNDSIWIDLGYPVKTLPDGRKYKPLFAFLVRDLDSLVNLNVHGNNVGQASGVPHLSNQGWGKWEVNLGSVLNAGTNEWAQLLTGNAGLNLPGRYGSDQVAGLGAPTPTNAPAFSPIPHVSAQVDYRGATIPGGMATQKPILPGTGTNPTYASIPQYPGSWDNGTGAALVNHPLVFNYFNPGIYPNGGDYLFRVSELKKLLCPTLSGRLDLSDSTLAQLCPQNFQDPAYGGAAGADRRRRLVTPLSMDLDRAGVSPFIWDANDATTRYVLNVPGPFPFPTGAGGTGSIGFPALKDRNSTPSPAAPNLSEFGTVDWRALSAQLSRINLNRPLAAYPLPDPTTHAIDLTVNQAAYNQALSDRQQLALDIYKVLRTVTGAMDPDAAFASAGTVTSPEFNALRYLAQLAVNIVDFIDSDNYNTPFPWYIEAGGTGNTHWVYGTELPGLLLNEHYIELTDDPTSYVGGKATNYIVNFWLELYNPRMRDLVIGTTQSDPDNGDTLLRAGANSIYQIQITKPNAQIRQPDNTDGHADNNPGQVYSTESGWGMGKVANALVPAQSPNPVYGQTGGVPMGGEQGFYLIGPQNTTMAPIPFPGTGAGDVPTANLDLSTQNMSVKVPVLDLGDPATAGKGPSILLQRLACPHLPSQPNPAAANYNPYITVDYVQTRHSTAAGGSDELNDATTVPPAGWANAPKPPEQRFAWGRNQPYAADVSLRQKQAPQAVTAPPPYTTRPQHTLGRQNGQEETPPPAPDTIPPPNPPTQTLQLPFDWLVHLDRQLISPMELIHVSGFKPHELTQQFMKDVDGNLRASKVSTEKFQHRAPWTDANARIFRALEFLSTGERSAGGGTFGRIPGKVNINGIWDYETFLALCDPQTSNGFTATDVQNAYNALFAVGGRSPGYNPTTGVGGPGASDRPFRGLAVPFSPGSPGDAQYPSPTPGAPGIGINDTLLNTGIFLPADATDSTHPYQRFELLTKIFNNITTRSNTFAVWCTVGNFQVLDDTTRPVKLGAEFGAAQGQNIRHRFFAIVDRTNLSLPGTLTSLAPPVTANATPQTIQIGSLTGSLGPPTVSSRPIPWNIQPGTVLEIDAGQPTAEIVVVTGVTQGPPPTITAVFSQTHAAGASVTIPGLTGPPPIFLNATSAPYQDPGPPPTYWVNVPALGGSYDGIGYLIQAGSTLVLDVGNNQETVSVLATGTDPVTMSPRFQVANITKPHANGFVISNTPIGNPGPQPQFNYKDPRYAPVVRFFAILD
jgi:hypothetical protein